MTGMLWLVQADRLGRKIESVERAINLMAEKYGVGRDEITVYVPKREEDDYVALEDVALKVRRDIQSHHVFLVAAALDKRE